MLMHHEQEIWLVVAPAPKMDWNVEHKPKLSSLAFIVQASQERMG